MWAGALLGVSPTGSSTGSVCAGGDPGLEEAGTTKWGGLRSGRSWQGAATGVVNSSDSGSVGGRWMERESWRAEGREYSLAEDLLGEGEGEGERERARELLEPAPASEDQ